MKTFLRCRKSSRVLSENRFRELSLHVDPAAIVVLGLLVNWMPMANSASVPLGAMLTPKKSAFPSAKDVSAEYGYVDRDSRFPNDDLPIMVPKRAALILDRILKEIESAKDGNQLINDWSPISRRGNNKDKLYFRCYFNAVSCYKRK